MRVNVFTKNILMYLTGVLWTATKANGKWTDAPSCYSGLPDCGKLNVQNSMLIDGDAETT